MAVEVARGEINIGLNDRDALNGLNRLRAEYAAKMAEIDRMEADVTLGADTSELDTKLKKAKDNVRILKGERATVKIDADKKELDKEIAEAEALVKRLDGKKARIEIETRGMETALAQEEALRKLEAKRAAEENRFARQRLQMAQQDARSRASLERQRMREMANAERSAYRENEQRRMSAVNVAKEAREVIRLQQEYAKLTDKLENLHRKQGRTFGKEARAKLELDTSGVVAHMEEIKARLNVMGKHPPVEIKVDTDQGFFKRQMFGLRKMAESALTHLGGVGTTKINIGPLSMSLRTLGLVLATLGPLVTDLGGALVGLVGVLGTGLAGAGAVAGGVMAGLALNFGGVFAAVKPVVTQFQTARKATQAYNMAVLKYGKDSKQAKTAQEQMNSVLKQVDPNVRRAAIGAAHLGDEWRRLTHQTASRDIGKVLGEGVKTLDALMPTLAKNTNRTFDILGHRIGGMLRDLRTPGAIKIFDSLGKSANNFLDPALKGIEHLGAAFGHIAESAARIFAGPAGRGFNRWAADIDKATQPGAKLDAEIRKIGRNASELIHFFGALGRLMVDVFNGGSRSGERMVVSMTDALNRWDQFLSSAQGKQSMADFFSRAEKGARALWGALAPLIAAFVQWSNLLSPFTAGILKGVGFVSQLVLGFSKLIGLGGPLAVLGTTLGGIFAVSKLAAFVGMLSRVVQLTREAAAAGSVIGGAKTFFGGLGGALRGGGGLQAGGAAAGAEIQAAMVEGGAAAAAEIRAAMAAGGAVSGAEGAAGMVARDSGLLVPAGALAGEETAAVGASGAMAGLSVATLGVGAALAAATGAILYFHGKATQLNGTIKSLLANDDAMNRSIGDTTTALNDVSPAALQAAQSHLTLREAQKQYNALVKQGKQHTDEGRQALINLRQAEYDDVNAKKRLADSAGGVTKGMREQIDVAKQGVDARKKELEQAQKRIDQDKKLGNALAPSLKAKDEKALRDATVNYTAALELQTQAQARARVADLARQRALALLPPLSDKAAAALQRLARTQGGSGRIAQSIATNFKNPAQVATTAASALQAGVPRAAVLNVVANTSNARKALQELNALRLDPKDVQARVNEGEALTKLARINGIKLSPKTQRLLAAGDADVIARIRKIVAQRTPPKNTHLTATDSASRLIAAVIGVAAGVPPRKNTLLSATNQATGIISTVLQALSAIPAVKTMTLIVKKIGAGLSGKAMGGEVTPEEKAAQRVMQRAESAGTRKTNGGVYHRPTLLVGEESRTEYVIATNPSYRAANEAYLAQAAAELGYAVTPAKKGKGKKKKKEVPGHHDKNAPNYQSHDQLPLMDTNSIRSDYIESYYSGTVGDFNKWTNKANTDARTLKQANNRYRDTPKDKKHDKQRRNMLRQIARAEAHWRTAERRRRSLADDATLATKDYKEYGTDRNTVDQMTSDMNRLARTYNDNGDPHVLDQWRTAKSKREGALTDIAKLLTRIKGRRAAKKFLSDINKQLSSVNDDLNASQLEDDPTGPDAAAPPTLDSFIESLGRTGELSGDLKAEALAKTTPDTSDDEAARSTLESFYRSVLGAAQASGQPDSVVTDAANALAGYLKPADSGTTDTSNDPDLQAQLAQAQNQAAVANAQNAINASALSVFGGPGDMGTAVFSNAYSAARYEGPSMQAGGGSQQTVSDFGSANPGASGPTIIIQTLHPGDSQTLDAIGQAATAGMGLQGAVSSPRLVSGL